MPDDAVPVRSQPFRRTGDVGLPRRILATGALRLAPCTAVGDEPADARRWILHIDERGHLMSAPGT